MEEEHQDENEEGLYFKILYDTYIWQYPIILASEQLSLIVILKQANNVVSDTLQLVDV